MGVDVGMVMTDDRDIMGRRRPNRLANVQLQFGFALFDLARAIAATWPARQFLWLLHALERRLTKPKG